MRPVTLVAGLVACGVVMLLGKGAFSGLSWNQARNAEQRKEAVGAAMLADPAFAALKARDPQAFQRTRDSVSATTQAKPEDRDALIDEARHEINFLLGFDARLRVASDEAVIAYALAVAGAAEELGARDAALCANYLLAPIAERKDFTRILSVAQRRADAEATAGVIGDPHPALPQTAPFSGSVHEAARPVVGELLRRFGDEWTVIDNPYGADPARVCEVMAAYYRAMAGQPAEKAGLLLRASLRRHG